MPCAAHTASFLRKHPIIVFHENIEDVALLAAIVAGMPDLTDLSIRKDSVSDLTQFEMFIAYLDTVVAGLPYLSSLSIGQDLIRGADSLDPRDLEVKFDAVRRWGDISPTLRIVVLPSEILAPDTPDMLVRVKWFLARVVSSRELCGEYTRIAEVVSRKDTVARLRGRTGCILDQPTKPWQLLYGTLAILPCTSISISVAAAILQFLVTMSVHKYHCMDFALSEVQKLLHMVATPDFSDGSDWALDASSQRVIIGMAAPCNVAPTIFMLDHDGTYPLPMRALLTAYFYGYTIAFLGLSYVIYSLARISKSRPNISWSQMENNLVNSCIHQHIR
ncbi:hypothetical protein FB451DRAFT_1524676 [Mycena latifolia]|nr:hypothetical protein FB451DRAFT_1524676 [Mycena latifolia]